MYFQQQKEKCLGFDYITNLTCYLIEIRMKGIVYIAIVATLLLSVQARRRRTDGLDSYYHRCDNDGREFGADFIKTFRQTRSCEYSTITLEPSQVILTRGVFCVSFFLFFLNLSIISCTEVAIRIYWC